MNMIETLNQFFQDKRDYFWSISLEKKLIVGGYIQNKYLGEVNLNFSNNQAIIKIEISNGLSSSKNHSVIFYEKGSTNYELSLFIYDKIEKYISEPETQNYQDANRSRLIENTFNNLPKY